MESLFNELKKNLEKQQDNLKQLVNIAREHNRALRQLDAGKLSRIIGSEEAIASMINREEESRRKITDSLAEVLGVEKDAVLSVFIESAPNDIKKDLSSLLESMNKKISELTEINELNGALTRQALRFNETILKMFAPKGKNVYTPHGKRADESLNLSLLDRKV